MAEIALSAVVAAVTALLVARLTHEYAKDKMRVEIKIEILRELWKTLFDLHHAAINLRPVGDTVDPNESEKERQDCRLQKYLDAAHACWKVIRHNKPFYPREIHDIADELLQKALREALEYDLMSPDQNVRNYSKDYWDNATKNIDSIKQIVNRAERAIRKEVEAQII